MKVIAVGDACIDLYQKLERYYPTGNCVDFIINIAKYGLESAVVSVVGTDRYGDEMIEVLKKYKVDSSHMHR